MTTPALRHDGPPAGPNYSLADIERMAALVAKSRLFPGIADPTAAAALMMLCQAEGLHPMQALRRFHVIQGRPAMRADAMLAEFQARGGFVRWVRHDATEARAAWGHKQHQPEPIELAVTFAEMKAAGLTGKDNWRTFPDAMLRARLISKAVRMIDPGVVVGIYTPEEVQDFAPERAREATPGQAAAADPSYSNGSGHGRGVYASPEDHAAYAEWVRARVESGNAAWLDYWTGHGVELPAAKESHWVVNAIQMTGHLLKWAVATHRLAPVAAASVDQRERLVAVEFARDPEAVEAEAVRYWEAVAADKTARYFAAEYARIEGHDSPTAEPAPAEREPGSDDDLEPAVVAAPPAPLPPPSGENTPRSGKALFAYVKDAGLKHEIDLFKYITGWARLHDFPARMVDYDPDQVGMAYAEAQRKLAAIRGTSDVHEEALA